MNESLARPYATFRTLAVPAQARTKMQLGPGLYSLSTLSTVPYVSFIGLGQHEKLFSWGELVEVPRGKLVTVKNASYHQGDVFVNAGQDYAAQPFRVTVPVPVTVSVFGPPAPQTQITPSFAVDTRRAKNAWFVMAILTDGNLPRTSTVRGRASTHSHPTASVISGPGVGFDSGGALPANTFICRFPLGYCASVVTDIVPHVLLDIGEIELFLPATVVPAAANAYYLLEY